MIPELTHNGSTGSNSYSNGAVAATTAAIATAVARTATAAAGDTNSSKAACFAEVAKAIIISEINFETNRTNITFGLYYYYSKLKTFKDEAGSRGGHVLWTPNGGSAGSG